MFAKLRISLHEKLFPCHQTMVALFERHARATDLNTAARERLQAACQQGQVCRAEYKKAHQ